MNSGREYFSLLGLFWLSESFVFQSDLVELLHVLVELVASLQSNEQLCLLGVASLSLYSDGSGLDFFECSVSISAEMRSNRIT